MFDQLKNIKELAGMMGNLGDMRQQFEQAQAELAKKTVEADAGAGAVTVTANGKLEIIRVQIDPAMTGSLAGEGNQADRELIEELIASATNAALGKAQMLIQEEMGQFAGGLDLPPGLEQLLEEDDDDEDDWDPKV